MLTISRTPAREQKKNGTQGPMSSQAQPSAILGSRAPLSTAPKSAYGSSGVLVTT
jgi:hypothetical protein